MRIGEVRHPERAGYGKPLDGVRVLSLEQMQALPYATQLMAHLGAEVVKVEPPGRGDSGRASQPAVTDADGRRVGATFLRNNLSKRSIAVDVEQDAGRDLVRRLVPHFDVVAENFRAGALARRGLGYADLAALRPGLVYVSISGFGQDQASPYVAWPAYAPVGEAMGGLYEPNREEGRPPPVVVAGALGDNASALFAVIGTLGALRQRDRTGEGQHVDVAIYDAVVAINDMLPFMWSMGLPPVMCTPRHFALVASFRARDGWFVVACFREHQFERLARCVGRPEWCGDPRFATREGWARHRESVIRPAVEAWARERGKLEAARALCERGVPAGPSNDGADLRADPHVRLRDMLIEVPRTDADSDLLVVGNPVKLSRTAEGPVASFPRLGEHTDAVLREALGLGAAELAELRARGVIG
jgi:formyl-CoA transferase